jgi:beta-aspartyl-peptidase (threonine type)
VGAVARDQQGNLAAATSTGGLTNQRPGRVGDSPLVGAGTYAQNATCAVSCTGEGEYFIRALVAHTVSMRMELLGEDAARAATAALKSVDAAGGHGGLIVLDAQGNIAMPFNTSGMFRGYVRGDGAPVISIFE